MRKIFIVMLSTFFGVSTLALGAEEKIIVEGAKLTSNCTIFSGKNVTYNFRSGTTSGNISNEYKGVATLEIAKFSGLIDLIKVSVTEDKGKGIAEFVVFKKASYRLGDYIYLSDQFGQSIDLRRVYKNEWYGNLILQEHQEDSHIVFVKPMKCIIDEGGNEEKWAYTDMTKGQTTVCQHPKAMPMCKFGL